MVEVGGISPSLFVYRGGPFPGVWVETITAFLRGQMIFQPGALRGEWLLTFTAIFGTTDPAELMTRCLSSEIEIRLMVSPSAPR